VAAYIDGFCKCKVEKKREINDVWTEAVGHHWMLIWDLI